MTTDGQFCFNISALILPLSVKIKVKCLSLVCCSVHSDMQYV